MYRIAVAGCGMVSDEWIRAALGRSDSVIAALVGGTDIDKVKAKAKQYSLEAGTYLNLTEAIEKENINLVFDLSPPECHYNTVTTALNLGCNVFGEKPLSNNLADAYKMVECAEKTGKEYFVMQNRRYIPELYGLRNFLKDGTIGAIGQLSASFQLDPHFGGFREDMESPLIADMAIHTFDAARFISGKDPVSVYCCEFNPKWSWYKGDANAICIFEMEDGVYFDYRGSWCATGLITSWESEWRIACEKGSAFWDGTNNAYYELASETVKTGLSGDVEEEAELITIESAPLAKTKHEACIEEMFDALNNGTRPQTDCRDNIKSIEMVFKAIESSRTGKKIVL